MEDKYYARIKMGHEDKECVTGPWDDVREIERFYSARSHRILDIFKINEPIDGSYMLDAEEIGGGFFDGNFNELRNPVQVTKEIREIQAQIKASNNNTEKLLLECKELNPLLVLWAKLALGIY